MQGWHYGKGLIYLKPILEILALNLSALCRIASLAFTFVIIPTSSERSDKKEPFGFIYALIGPLAFKGFYYPCVFHYMEGEFENIITKPCMRIKKKISIYLPQSIDFSFMLFIPLTFFLSYY